MFSDVDAMDKKRSASFSRTEMSTEQSVPNKYVQLKWRFSVTTAQALSTNNSLETRWLLDKGAVQGARKVEGCVKTNNLSHSNFQDILLLRGL